MQKSFRTSRELMQLRRRISILSDNEREGCSLTSEFNEQNSSPSNSLSGSSIHRPKSQIVNLESLSTTYSLEIPVDATVERMICFLWRRISGEDEKCARANYHLFLYNHRTQIFPDAFSEVVINLVALTPRVASTHFYFYLVRNTLASSPYECDNVFNNDYQNVAWWNLTSFCNESQCSRPLSILLVSIHALRLLFNQQRNDAHRTLENRFLKELSKYMFLPGIIALKHALDGWMFFFEKPLLVDSFLKILFRFCPSTLADNMLCDSIPLLFCWLLEQVKMDNGDEDPIELFQEIIDNETQAPSNSLRSSRTVRDPGEYLFYNYCASHSPSPHLPPTLSRVEAESLYNIMMKNYEELSSIAACSIYANADDELLLFQCFDSSFFFTNGHEAKPRTLMHTCTHDIYDRVNAIHSNDLKQHAREESPIRSDFAEDSRFHERPVPCSTREDSMQQIVMVLFDSSRSMFENKALSGGDHSPTIAQLSKEFLYKMQENICAFGDNAIGLICFGDYIETLCPITVDLAEFTRAVTTLNIEPQGWTKMYDAILKAIADINDFEKDILESVSTTKSIKKRIVCLSDGMNNSGSGSLAEIEYEVKNKRITVDFVCFLSEETFNINIRKEIERFRKLCINSGGQARSRISSCSSDWKINFAEEATKVLQGTQTL